MAATRRLSKGWADYAPPSTNEQSPQAVAGQEEEKKSKGNEDPPAETGLAMVPHETSAIELTETDTTGGDNVDGGEEKSGGETQPLSTTSCAAQAQEAVLVFAIFVAMVAAIALCIYGVVYDDDDDDDGADNNDDGADNDNDEQRTKFNYPMVEYFFDKDCLNAMDDDDDALRTVDDYMGLWIGSLSFPSVLQSCVQVSTRNMLD